jgi:hypothetical protein
MLYIIELAHDDKISYWTGSAPGSKAMAILYGNIEDANNASCYVQEFRNYRCTGVKPITQEFSTQIVR